MQIHTYVQAHMWRVANSFKFQDMYFDSIHVHSAHVSRYSILSMDLQNMWQPLRGLHVQHCRSLVSFSFQSTSWIRGGVLQYIYMSTREPPTKQCGPRRCANRGAQSTNGSQNECLLKSQWLVDSHQRSPTCASAIGQHQFYYQHDLVTRCLNHKTMSDLTRLI